MNIEDDWFAKVAFEAQQTAKAARAREVERVRKAAIRRATPPARPREAAEALRVFEEVATGSIAPLGAGPGVVYYSASTPPPFLGIDPASSRPAPRPSKPTPAQGLDAIIDAVKNAGDADAVLKAGGEWITKVTNAISEIIREADD